MEEKTLTGQIIKIYGTVYYVKCFEEVFSCKLKGKLKLLQTKNDEDDPRMKEKLKLLKATNTKNPLVVGDMVKFEPLECKEIKEKGYMQGVILELMPRKNKISRTFVDNRKKGAKEQFIAANIDYVLCVNSIKEPKLNTTFIDRIIVTCEKEGIEPIIIINKIDLDYEINDEDNKKLSQEIKEIYEPLGYKVLCLSAINNIGLDELKRLIKDKIVVLTGYSGVGKSTIINTIIGSELLRVGEISYHTNKGRHTTSTSQLIEIPDGGYIIDTPGLSEFGIYNIDEDDLYHYFRELRDYTGKCKYTPCTHSHEPDCAVKRDVENGKLNIERYSNYIKILFSLEGKR